jgi:hypothetical protein
MPQSRVKVSEEVLVYLLQGEGLLDHDAAVVLDHQICQLRAVDEDKPSVDAFSVVLGFGAESGRGDEDTP